MMAIMKEPLLRDDNFGPDKKNALKAKVREEKVVE